MVNIFAIISQDRVDFMKKLDVLGVSLKERSSKEALKLTEQYLNSGGLNTVVHVSARQLVAAAEDEKQKKHLEAMDLTVFEDQDILKAVHAADGNKPVENGQREYLKELFKRLVKEKCPVYLLAASEEELLRLHEELDKHCAGLTVVGRSIVPPALDTEYANDLVNEINSVAPQVILSVLPFAMQNAFVNENKMLMNASVFLGLPEYGVSGDKPGGFAKFTKYFYKKILKRKLMKYNNEEKTE